MKVFLLPGQSISNKEWIEGVEKKFKEISSDTEVLYYEHWSLGEKDTNISLETEKLVKLVNSYTDDYIVFTKSIGSLVFLNSFKDLKRKPKVVLMLGFPYYLAKELDFDLKSLFNKIDFKVNIYQKEYDTAGKYEEVKPFSNEYVTVEKYVSAGEPNDNHSYVNLENISKLLKSLIS